MACWVLTKEKDMEINVKIKVEMCDNCNGTGKCKQCEYTPPFEEFVGICKKCNGTGVVQSK